MSNRTHGTTLEELCEDHSDEGEVLRRQLDSGEEVDIYVVGRDSEILALTPQRLYIIKPGLRGISDATAVGFLYNKVSHVAMHALQGDYAFEVQTADAMDQVESATGGIDCSLPNIIPLEEPDLPEFEGALASVLERVAKAQR